MDPLEILWDQLLSREPQQIRAAFSQLNAADRQGVFNHLQRMASEDGWQPEQRRSAEAALEALKDLLV
jgi:hypothetical protein